MSGESASGQSDRRERGELAELAALARVSPLPPLSPIPDGVAPEIRDFAETLRILFRATGMSLNRLAALLHSDPGTVSRYLSGQRIPPPDFIAGLCKAVYDVKGSLITEQVQEFVHEQFLVALREHNPARYEVQRLTDLLEVAAQKRRQYEITVAALEEAIASRNERIYALELEGRQLRSSWIDAEGLLEQERERRKRLEQTIESLYTQVTYFKEQLLSAQQRAMEAEGRCRELEAQLDAAGALLQAEDQPTGGAGLAGQQNSGFPAGAAVTGTDTADSRPFAHQATGEVFWTKRLTGRIAEDWPDEVRPDDSAQVQQRWQEGVASAAPFSIGYRVHAGTGSYQYFEISAIPIARHGEIAEWSITSADVTDQREAGQYEEGSQATTSPESAGLLNKTRAEQDCGQIVTFYSFDGGTGRTMAIANIAWILAANGYRVLVADWDLESPGLHRFFQPFMDARTSDRPGIVDLIRGYAWAMSDAEIDPEALHRADTPREAALAISARIDEHIGRLESYVIPLSWQFPDGGALHFLSPGEQDDSDYQATLSYLNWDNFYENLYGDRFMTALRTFLKSRYDYVLIDSRTGHGDVADICTVHLPDMVIDCFTLTNQGIEGAAMIARAIRDHSNRDITILPVPMRIDHAQKEKVDTGIKFAASLFAGLPTGMSEQERHAYWAEVRVPYRPSYAYDETLAVFGDQPGSQGSLLSSYERIARRITANAVTALPPRKKWLRPGRA
jgi:MinD-like ATPase involved in chromosome partitioning or flagellar assembly/transcriptional regulator with XRE-family HTH domain